MYRSGSWSRPDGEDYFIHRMAGDYYSSQSLLPTMRSASAMEVDDKLPDYDPTMETSKKEKSRAKFAENAVHVIPFVLLLCGLVLWIFSNPDVNVGVKTESIAARIEGLTIEGDIDTDSDGTQTGFLPLDHSDSSETYNNKHLKVGERYRKLATFLE